MLRTFATMTAWGTALSVYAASPAFARPVSYEGGWTVIEETDRQSASLLVHYTPNASYSIGWKSEWDRQEDIALHGPQLTYLAKRWFGEDYQANLYAFAGAGWAEGVNDNPIDQDEMAYVGLLADWETRTLFASYKARYLEGGQIDGSVMQAARAGWAPYEGDTGDLHTWLMVEVDHRPDNEEEVGVTPLVRLFKGAALFELGWSVTDDEPLINFTYRF